MPTIDRGNGVTVTVPEGFTVVGEATPPGGGRRRRALPPGAQPSESDAILDALEAADLDVVDTFTVVPGADTGRRGRAGARRGPADTAPRAVAVAVDAAEGEAALVLVEQDGVYRWQLPPQPQELAPGARRRGGAGPAGGRKEFVVELEPAAPPRSGRRRGVLGDLVLGQVKVHVLKFLAGRFVEHQVAQREKNVVPGLVEVTAPADAASWARHDDISALDLPTDRPPRLLLFVHGTFSSTRGSFGHLTHTAWGQAFLADAKSKYDAVIGIDHYTLIESPLDNAKDLARRLSALPAGSEIDAIAFSRGGLVLRAFTELVAPELPGAPTVSRAIFVGSTNGGTRLAEPENWGRLLDLYTTLAAAGSRAAPILVPQAALAAAILKETIGGLASFAKHVVAYGSEADKVPGLAALRPSGELVTKLNEGDPRAILPAGVRYYAVVSDFDVEASHGGRAPELSERVLLAVADMNIDRLMGEGSDLVVNVSSMTRFGPDTLGVAGLVRERYDFGGPNARIYHVVYFTRLEVVERLREWLGLPAAAGTALRGLGPAAPSGLPVIERRLYVLHARSLVRDTLDELADLADHVRYIVLERFEGRPLHYAFTPGELRERLREVAPDSTVEAALDLQEGDASPSVEADDAEQVRAGDPGPADPDHPARGRTVALEEDGWPVGVLAADVQLPTIDQLARRNAPPDRIGGSRTTRSGRQPAARTLDFSYAIAERQLAVEDIESPVPAEPVTIHVQAQMPDPVPIDEDTHVQVEVSREALVAAVEGASDVGGTQVAEDQPILLWLVPRVNATVVGDDQIKVDVPHPDEPAIERFTIRAVSSGQVEVWLEVRQGQQRLLRLKLRAQAQDQSAAAAERRTASGRSVLPEALSLGLPVNQLTIFEVSGQGPGSQAGLRFLLDLPDEPVVFRTYKLDGIAADADRDAYIRSYYESIEQRWLDSDGDIADFELELQDFGKQLFDDLFPLELRLDLWTHRDRIDSIHVLSEEPLIPWEMVHLKSPDGSETPSNGFLGQMGLVRWLSVAEGPTKRLRVRPGRVRYVVPDYGLDDDVLPETHAEREFLEQKLGATGITGEGGQSPTYRDIRSVIEEPGAVDLLHFSGHCEAQPGSADEASLILGRSFEGSEIRVDRFKAFSLRQNARFRSEDGETTRRAIVVLNACQSGQQTLRLGGTGGFANACLVAGAGAFVGPLWSVSDRPARTFVEALYEALLDGKTLAEAATAARAAAQTAGEGSWLAYCVYGHPHATLQRETP